MSVLMHCWYLMDWWYSLYVVCQNLRSDIRILFKNISINQSFDFLQFSNFMNLNSFISFFAFHFVVLFSFLLSLIGWRSFSMYVWSYMYTCIYICLFLVAINHNQPINGSFHSNNLLSYQPTNWSCHSNHSVCIRLYYLVFNVDFKNTCCADGLNILCLRR